MFWCVCVCGIEHMGVHECLLTSSLMSCSGFSFLLSFIFLKFLNSFGFCLNLVIMKAVLDAQGRDWTVPFFQPIDFFSADAHEMRPQLSNYTVKSRRYAGICPLWGSRKPFFSVRLSAQKGNIFISVAIKLSKWPLVCNAANTIWNDLLKTLAGLFWCSPQPLLAKALLIFQNPH